MSNEIATDINLKLLVASVQESAKYRAVCADAIRRIGQRELAVRRNLKEAVKETKNTLHQMAGAYLDGKMRYADWLTELHEAADIQTACRSIMAHHASTRERLPFLEPFYATALADIAPLRSVLDVACGLNPLAVPLISLAADAQYFACDLFSDMTDFLNAVFPLLGIQGEAFTCDVLTAPPTQKVQIAFVFKLLPLLEQWDKSAGRELLRALNADTLLVSFPTRTLGGRGKGMGATYETRFRALAESEGWPYRRFEFPNELCFLVTKSPAP